MGGDGSVAAEADRVAYAHRWVEQGFDTGVGLEGGGLVQTEGRGGPGRFHSTRQVQSRAGVAASSRSMRSW